MLQYYFWHCLSTNTSFLFAIFTYNRTDRVTLANAAKYTDMSFRYYSLANFLLLKILAIEN